jgi:hypothetical protein
MTQKKYISISIVHNQNFFDIQKEIRVDLFSYLLLLVIHVKPQRNQKYLRYEDVKANIE